MPLKKITASLNGEWAIVDKKYLKPSSYEEIHFDQVETLKTFTVKMRSGEIDAGEWEIDYSDNIIVMDVYYKKTGKEECSLGLFLTTR